MEISRIAAKDITGANEDRLALACIETLLKIAQNVLNHPNEQKYSSMKASNKLLQTKVLNAKGGEDYLMTMGFRPKSIQLVEYYAVDPFPIRPSALHMIKLCVDVLEAFLPPAQKKANHASNAFAILKNKEIEEARRAEALAQFDEDRGIVRRRVEREKIVREGKKAKAALAKAQADAEVMEEEQEAQGGSGSGGPVTVAGLTGMLVDGESDEGDHHGREEEEDGMSSFSEEGSDDDDQPPSPPHSSP